MKLSLKNNKGFRWCKYQNIYFKGNFILDNVVYNSNLFNNQTDHLPKDIIENDSLKKTYGQFLFVVEEDDAIIVITDFLRSFNLFYQKNNSEYIISDVNDKFNKKDINNNCLNEFTYTGFVTNNNTIYNGVKSLESCRKYIFKNDKVTSLEYFKFKYHHTAKINCKEKINSIYDAVFKDFITATKDKTIVIPLSGGYDSRIIVQYLHKFKVPNKVICFTYGVKGNKESNISKEVANFYGYEWHFVEYTKSKWSQSRVLKYVQETFDGVSLPHIQDFIAIKELKDNKLIPDDAVIVPGHSGDFIAGSHLNQRVLNCKTREVFVYEILWKNYILNFSLNFKMLYSLVNKQVEKYLNNSDYVNSFEEWNFKERQAKFIVNSVRVYEYFGYEWSMPLWDVRLIEFWLKVNNQERLNRKLYFEFISSKDKWHILEKKNNLVTELKIYKYYLKWARLIYLNITNSILNKEHPMGWYGIFNYKFKFSHSSINSLLVKRLVAMVKNK